eukprot:967553-Pleurochrysis_carterae.AAC.2
MQEQRGGAVLEPNSSASLQAGFHVAPEGGDESFWADAPWIGGDAQVTNLGRGSLFRKRPGLIRAQPHLLRTFMAAGLRHSCRCSSKSESFLLHLSSHKSEPGSQGCAHPQRARHLNLAIGACELCRITRELPIV